MLGKLFLSHRGILATNLTAGIVGIGLVIGVDSPRVGTIVFLLITALESGAFSLAYALRGTWRAVPAARAVFWAVLAYWALATHTLTLYLWTARWWWTDDLRELLYLGLAVAGLNLLLTLAQQLGYGPRTVA